MPKVTGYFNGGKKIFKKAGERMCLHWRYKWGTFWIHFPFQTYFEWSL